MIQIKEKIKRYFSGGSWRVEEHHINLNLSDSVEARFLLTISNLEVGNLIAKEGIWYFVYSNKFREQDKIKPLLNFPDLNKEYSNEELYPFFISRIPGLNQPKVREVLVKEQIPENDLVALLKRFGKRTIDNPFILQSV